MTQSAPQLLKVLHSLSYAENGGAQVVVANLVSQGDKNGVVSYVSFWRTKKHLPSCMSDVKDVVYFRGPSLFRIYRAVRFVSRNDIDVLHSHTNRERREMSIVSMLTMRPHIVHIHTRIEVEGQFKTRKNIVRRYLHKFLQKHGVQRFIATSELVEDSVNSFHVQRNMTRIEPGINFDRFKDLPREGSRVALEIEVPQGMYLLGCPSRAEEKKGIETLIAAASRVDNAYVIIAGVGSQRRKYERSVEKLGLSHRILFVDRYDNMPAFYSACDIVVVPSEEESFSLVYLESIASRRCVVASDIEPFEFGRKYVNMFRRGDAHSLEKVLRQTLERLHYEETINTHDLEELMAQYSMQGAAEKIRAQYNIALESRRIRSMVTA